MPTTQPDTTPNYFHIVGVGRSGTTLLMSMMNAHPDVVVLPETHFVRQHLVPHPQSTRAELVTRLAADTPFARAGLSLDTFLSVYDAVGEQTLSSAAVYKHLLTSYTASATETPPLWIGDKDPKDIEHISVLANALPNSWLLHMVRDPRDVFLSRSKADWSKDSPPLTHLLAYRSQFELGRADGRRYFGKRYLEIQYEQLIRQPEQTLKAVCARMGLEWSPQMLMFQQAAEKLVSADEMQWKGTVLKPLMSDNLEKWRDGALTDRQILSLEGACAPVFSEGLYMSAFARPSLTQRGRKQFWNVAVGSAAAVYRWRVRRRNQKVISQL